MGVTPPTGLGPVTDLTQNTDNVCVRTADGTPACWGSTPIDFAATQAAQVSAGSDHACLIDAEGSVDCLGSDSYGQLFKPATFASSAPSWVGVGGFRFAPMSTAGRPAATFAVTSGTLPNGLTLDPATGEISGTATAEGDEAITITGSNGLSAPATKSVTLKVDLTAPVTADDVPATPVTAAVPVTLHATDTRSAVAHTYYTKGVSPAVPTSASAEYDPANKPVLADGEQIRYFSVDKAGNTEPVKSSAAVGVLAPPPAPTPTPEPPVKETQAAVAVPKQLALSRDSITLRVTCSVVCRATGTGTVSIGKRRFGKLSATPVAVTANAKARVKLRTTKALRTKLRAYLKRHPKAVATFRLTVKVTTAAGTTTHPVTIKLRRLGA
jgi:hypothetical protein